MEIKIKLEGLLRIENGEGIFVPDNKEPEGPVPTPETEEEQVKEEEQVEEDTTKVEPKLEYGDIGMTYYVLKKSDSLYEVLMENEVVVIPKGVKWSFTLYKEIVNPKVKFILSLDSEIEVVAIGFYLRSLFRYDGVKPKVAIIGAAFVLPKARPRTAQQNAGIFSAGRDKIQSGMMAYIDARISDIDRQTFGLTEFMYSSESNGPDDRIYVIGENIHHHGFNFMQVKNPGKGNLWVLLNNVTNHNPIIEFPQSHYYTPTRFKVRGVKEGNTFRITSDNEFSQILTWAGYNNGNQRSILHFDRFVFDISRDQLTDDKTLNLYNRLNECIKVRRFEFLSNIELHAGDVTPIGTIVSKNIDASRKKNWIYTLDKEILDDRFTLNTTTQVVEDGEYDAYIAYKGNFLFQLPITVDTKFGEGYWESGIITMSQGYGWSWYCEEFSGVILNSNIQGYTWNTGGSGITQGLNVVNSSIEGSFTNKYPADHAFPNEANAFINQTRYLQQSIFE